MPVGPPSLPVPLAMHLTIPADPRFVAIAAAMTRLVAEQLGYQPAEAAKLAAEFERQATEVVPAGEPLAIRFEGTYAALKVHVKAGARTFELAPL
jgi:hypothetical protein